MFSITGKFPPPGPLVRHAYAELDLARSGTDDQKRALGKLSVLPRPWDPPSCPPALRIQVWAWLDQVADWINHEYVWQPDRFIPSCWPAHPHIARELAVIADLRRTAGYAFTGDALEEWHRYALPTFLERVTSRIGTCCGPAKHDDWPAAGRHRQFRSERATQNRHDLFSRDTAPTPDRDGSAPPAQTPPPLALINGSTVQHHDRRSPLAPAPHQGHESDEGEKTMNELLIAGTPVTLGDLVLLVEHQQDQISDLESQLTDLARQITDLRSGAGRVG